LNIVLPRKALLIEVNQSDSQPISQSCSLIFSRLRNLGLLVLDKLMTINYFRLLKMIYYSHFQQNTY